MSSLIPVTKYGEVVGWAFVDPPVAPVLRLVKWSMTSSGYANSTLGMMHRAVLGLRIGDAYEIDHINRNRLDNRRANLRIASRVDNVRNSSRCDDAEAARAEVQRLWETGMERREIAATVGCPYSTVAATLKGEGHHGGRHPNLIWTREALTDAIRAFHAAHGRLPRGIDLDGKNGRPFYSYYYRRFEGGMPEARECAGFGRIKYVKATA